MTLIINDLKKYPMSTKEQKAKIKKHYGSRFVDFVSARGKYITYVIKA